MPKVMELYAFIGEDSGPDDEGLLTVVVGGDGEIQSQRPLVGTDLERVRSLMSMAQSLSDAYEKSYKIVRFSQREEIGEVHPSMSKVGHLTNTVVKENKYEQ